MWTVYLFSALLLFLARTLFVSRGRLPPGPRPLPIIGNLLDVAKTELWRHAHQWGQELGDIICLHVFSTPFIIIERCEVAIALLSKRSTIYSDRPRMTMAGDMSGFDAIVPLTRAGERLNFDRKLMHTAFSPSAVKLWRPAVTREVHKLLVDFASTPSDFEAHFKKLASTLILNRIYGYSLQTVADPILKAAEDLMIATEYAATGGWIVDFFPLLRWLPGMTCRKIASQWRVSVVDWVEKPYEAFKRLPDNTDKRSSFCGSLMLSQDHNIPITPYFEDRVKWIAASMYGGGVDTTVTSLSQFIMIMVLHPDAQRKAQKELDDHLGLERLPCYEDRPHLPYTDCLLKETLRWGTPVSFAAPHRLTQRDEYRGYDFPEGSLFNANLWSLLRDDKVYEEPLVYNPDRFLDNTMPSPGAPPSDPYTYCFGFGRRRCPGIHFADQTLWLSVTSILTCFDISPYVGADGVPVLPELIFGDRLFRNPKPFKCTITPRREFLREMLTNG